MPETPDTELLDLTAGIVAAHVSNNTVGDRRWATLAARKRPLTDLKWTSATNC